MKSRAITTLCSSWSSTDTEVERKCSFIALMTQTTAALWLTVFYYVAFFCSDKVCLNKMWSSWMSVRRSSPSSQLTLKSPEFEGPPHPFLSEEGALGGSDSLPGWKSERSGSSVAHTWSHWLSVEVLWWHCQRFHLLASFFFYLRPASFSSSFPPGCHLPSSSSFSVIDYSSSSSPSCLNVPALAHEPISHQTRPRRS